MTHGPESEVRHGSETSARDGVDDVAAGANSGAAVVRVAGADVPAAVHAPQVEGAAAQEVLALPVGGQVLRQAEASEGPFCHSFFIPPSIHASIYPLIYCTFFSCRHKNIHLS